MINTKEVEEITKKIFRYYFENALPKIPPNYYTVDKSVRRRVIRHCKKLNLKVLIYYPKCLGDVLVYEFGIDPLAYGDIMDWVIAECELHVIIREYSYLGVYEVQRVR